MVLIVAFIALCWVQQAIPPQRPVSVSEAPATAVAPTGLAPNPSYTWVPRTDVSTSTTPTLTATPTKIRNRASTPIAPTTIPTTPTTSTSVAPITTVVVDPDGLGPLPPETQTLTPTSPSASTDTLFPPAPTATTTASIATG